jgi:large subunit ribosomal protein L1
MPSVEEVVEDLLRKALSQDNTKKRKFKQSVELYLNFRALDLKKAESKFASVVELQSFPPGRENKVAIITGGSLIPSARNLGIDVITREQVESASGNKKAARKIIEPYDFLISEAPLMSLVGRVFGPFLGPKDKMPVPVPPNADVAPLVNRLKKSVLIRLKTQKALSASIGTEDMNLEELKQNSMKIIAAVEERVPNGLRAVDSITIKTTMGRPVSSKLWVKAR